MSRVDFLLLKLICITRSAVVLVCRYISILLLLGLLSSPREGTGAFAKSRRPISVWDNGEIGVDHFSVCGSGPIPVKQGGLPVLDGPNHVGPRVRIKYQLILAGEGPGLLLLPLDHRRDGVLKLGLRDLPGLVPARDSEVRGGALRQDDLHLHVDFRHVLLGVDHTPHGAVEDLVEVTPQGGKRFAAQRQVHVVVLAHNNFLLIILWCPL